MPNLERVATRLKLTREQDKALREASDLISRVQVELLVAEEKLPKDERSEGWRELYRLRIELANFRDRMKP